MSNILANMKAAFLFPGQGSQSKGMGRDLAEHDPEVMAFWKLAERFSKAPLREIYWEGDEAVMAETRYQQPALVVVGLSVLKKLYQKLRPVAVAGHSVGEFAALAAARVLSCEKVLELVCLRGRLMFEAGLTQPGKMLAVLKLGLDKVEDIVKLAAASTGKKLCVANYNSPVQLVISGESKAVDHAARLVKEQKGRAVYLPVSGAFHSPLMAEAAKEFAKVMDPLEWQDARIPVYMNVTAKPETRGEVIKTIMARQMISSVRWAQLINAQWQDGLRHWFELGPKGVLTKLLGYILQDRDEEWTVQGVDSKLSLQGLGVTF